MGLRTAWALPLRLLSYIGVTSMMVLCQRQLLTAWHKHIAFAVDKTVGTVSPELRAGGIEYYSWKLKWNVFWAKKLTACRKAFSMLEEVSRGVPEGIDDLPPLLKHRYQTALMDSTMLRRNMSGIVISVKTLYRFNLHYDLSLIPTMTHNIFF